jgi:hypothetical protein
VVAAVVLRIKGVAVVLWIEVAVVEMEIERVAAVVLRIEGGGCGDGH